MPNMQSGCLVVVVLALSALQGCAHPQRSQVETVVVHDQEVGIGVSGVGEAEAKPDVAVFQIGVEARQASVEATRTAAANAQKAVLDALRTAGVANEDIQTTQLTVMPDYVYSEQGRSLKGYVVTNQVEVRVRDISKLQPAIDGGLRAGGDSVRLDSLRFEFSDPTQIEGEARKKAIEQARAKAEQLATLLGVKLGAPLSVQDMAADPGRPVMMRMERAAESDAAANTPVEPGTSKVRVEVRVQWAIAQ